MPAKKDGDQVSPSNAGGRGIPPGMPSGGKPKKSDDERSPAMSRKSLDIVNKPTGKRNAPFID